MSSSVPVTYLRLRVVVLCLLAAGALLVVVDYLFLSARLTLQEDGFVEWTSALAFLLGGKIATFALVTARSVQPRMVATVIAAAGILGFLDEWSFGQRSRFAYTPYMFYGVPLDGVHDIFEVAAVAARAHFGVVGFFAVPLLIGLLLVVAAWRFRAALLVLFRTSVALRYFALACGFVFGAAVLDLDFSTWNATYALEELLELSAALLIVGAGCAQVMENRAVVRARNSRVA